MDMCFSATASFSAGLALSAIGFAAVKKVRNPRHYMFATIPLIFAVQQFFEGLVWLSMRDDGYESMQTISAHAFIVIAQVFWPVWVPLSIYLMEDVNSVRKKMLLFLIFIGAIISIYVFINLFLYPISASIKDHHIYYSIHFPVYQTFYASTLYFLATVLPSFLSQYKVVRWLGVIILGAYIFSKLMFNENFISVWCFFGAIGSLIVYINLKEIELIPRENVRSKHRKLAIHNEKIKS